MGSRTAIEWTDATWNPIHGKRGYWTCVKVSPGCAHCYAERINMHRSFPAYRVGADEPTLYEPALTIPLGWKKPRRVFVCSMTDLFEERVPVDWIATIFAAMALAPHHTFQVLTKRAARMREVLADVGANLPAVLGAFVGRLANVSARRPLEAPWPLPNVWLGVSVENQEYADARIPELLATPAAVRFVSAEPLLGPIDLTDISAPSGEQWNVLDRVEAADAVREGGLGGVLDWLIVGGESGGPPERALVRRLGWMPKPEPLTWVISLRDQCLAAGVPFLFKQWGGPRPKSGGRELEGRTWEEFPQTEER